MSAPARDICPFCGGTYPAVKDGYNVHSGSDRHREAIAWKTRGAGDPDRHREARTPRRATYCDCGAFVPDSSGDAGCGNCGADYGPPE